MSEHYFSQKPHSKNAPKTWTYPLRGNTHTFTSDDGVFSKNKVDYGSRFLLESYVSPSIDGDILDLGCGYGPIGIVLASSMAERNIIMVDINERAIELAKQNIQHNNVSNIEVIQSDSFSNIKNHYFASVLTNPPIRAGKSVIFNMYEESKQSLKKDGELWVVIQKKQGAPSTRKKLESLFGNVETVGHSKGYFVFKSVNG